MGAALAAQRGWPERASSQSPRRSSSSMNTDDASGDQDTPSASTAILSNTFAGDQVLDETQPLEVGHRDEFGYHSTSAVSIQSLVPVERHSSFVAAPSGGASEEHPGSLDEDGVAYELETPRDVRGPSTAYDLSELSTEEEVCECVGASSVRAVRNWCGKWVSHRGTGEREQRIGLDFSFAFGLVLHVVLFCTRNCSFVKPASCAKQKLAVRGNPNRADSIGFC